PACGQQCRAGPARPKHATTLWLDTRESSWPLAWEPGQSEETPAAPAWGAGKRRMMNFSFSVRSVRWWVAGASQQAIRRRSLRRHEAVTQQTHLFDFHFAHVAALEQHRRLAGEAHSRRRAGEDHIAGHQRANLRD